MKKKCIITTKQHFIQKVDTDIDIYYIEDYIGFGNITKARLLTEKIFRNNKKFIDKFDYKDYKITWSWYESIFHFSLKYYEIIELINEIKDKNFKEIEIKNINLGYENIIKTYFYDKKVIVNKKFRMINYVKEFITNFILLIFTIISIVYFKIKIKNYTAIWIGDFIYKNTDSDFRLNHLYDIMKKNKINFIEFIRTRGLKNFIKNTYKRKRFSIYYFSIIYFVKFFTKQKVVLNNTCITSFEESVINLYRYENEILLKVVPILVAILKFIKIKNAIVFSFMPRNAHLVIAYKALNIKTIGIMHGLSRRDYLVTEFIEPYNEKQYLGPDIFGVWSPEYVKYYHKFCKIVPKNKIVYSGLLRPLNVFEPTLKFKKPLNDKIKILIISEPLVKAEEILPYIKTIIESNQFEVGIKVRPMIKDSFYERLKELYPAITNIKTYDGQILDDGKNFDIFLGSHSTAVIEASLIGKLSILVKTEKWGDYFGMNDLINGKKLLCESSDNIISYINLRLKEEDNLNTVQKIRIRFFGDNKDGAEWIINQIKKDEECCK